ncbi:hypothetical protein L3X38_027305 [Prunus dulcis]|uniref:Ammonium transporter AmtB-like domain-containing protein n=1 Tax=Prunus dulcis TaxID=3755 RepID=A0AAD4Z0A6_PRUDU|nr:hypothetical protein L3X38_027305 [Prunus dulcis]
MATMVWFQCMFAAITLILLAGSVLGRMNFKVWMMFVPLWLTFLYTVGAFSLWGGGFLFHWGVMDYSSGYVIHLSSGSACCSHYADTASGSLLGRMKFKARMMFVPLWLTFSYTVGAFSLWGGGFLFHWGVMDYSSGYVIHLSSGIAGYTTTYWVGPRVKKDRERFPPNNVLLVLAGAGLLWMGWAGFNGGDPHAANTNSSMAVLNTNICAATSFLVWTWLDVIFFEKPSVIGAVQGMITGLVCITPAAGTYYHDIVRFGTHDWALTGLFLEAHGATSQGVTHPGIAPASNSLNFDVPMNPKPVSSQKASCYEDARCAI